MRWEAREVFAAFSLRKPCHRHGRAKSFPIPITLPFSLFGPFPQRSLLRSGSDLFCSSSSVASHCRGALSRIAILGRKRPPNFSPLFFTFFFSPPPSQTPKPAQNHFTTAGSHQFFDDYLLRLLRGDATYTLPQQQEANEVAGGTAAGAVAAANAAATNTLANNSDNPVLASGVSSLDAAAAVDAALLSQRQQMAQQHLQMQQRQRHQHAALDPSS